MLITIVVGIEPAIPNINESIALGIGLLMTNSIADMIGNISTDVPNALITMLKTLRAKNAATVSMAIIIGKVTSSIKRNWILSINSFSSL